MNKSIIFFVFVLLSSSALHAQDTRNPESPSVFKNQAVSTKKKKRSIFKIFEKKEQIKSLEQERVDFQARMKKVQKEKAKQEKAMSKAQYSKHENFGHKRKPKKRPPGKQKLCKVCNIKH